MSQNLKLPASEFSDNEPRTIRTTVDGDVHTIHVIVDNPGSFAGGGGDSGGVDATEGLLSDEAITADLPGTISGKLRGLVKILGSAWNGVTGRLSVDGSGVTQPVSAQSLPLPQGAASESTLAQIRGVLEGDSGIKVRMDGTDSVQGLTTDAAVTGDQPGTISGKLRGLAKVLGSAWDSVSGRLRVDGSGVTQPVSAQNLPLPQGAATESTLAEIGRALQGDDGIKVRMESIPDPLYYTLASIARPIWMDPATGRLNINNVATVTTVSTVSNIPQMGGVDPKQTLFYANERANWALSVRSRID